MQTTMNPTFLFCSQAFDPFICILIKSGAIKVLSNLFLKHTVRITKLYACYMPHGIERKLKELLIPQF